jgi:hypothetical protein
VSVLVPVRRKSNLLSFSNSKKLIATSSLSAKGGTTAVYAWPRLAEYFARFHLIVDLCCSLEVMAPTLSRLPLFVQPLKLKERRAHSESSDKRSSLLPLTNYDEFWNDGFVDDTNDKAKETPSSIPCSKRPKAEAETTSKDQKSTEEARNAILDGVRAYLKLPVDMKNVALSRQPIRVEGDSTVIDRPIMEVAIVVYGTAEDHNSVQVAVDDSCIADRSARMMLVRMVNKVPLLDGAEALACGLVQGITSKQSLWNSFGLEVTNMSKDSSRKVTEIDEVDDEQFLDPANFFVPTFRVRDSEQVAPFFQQGTHRLFEEQAHRFSDDDDVEDDSFNSRNARTKRKRKGGQPLLLPAQVRLGNILVIANIFAKPSSLPLPSLSKVRLVALS